MRDGIKKWAQNQTCKQLSRQWQPSLQDKQAIFDVLWRNSWGKITRTTLFEQQRMQRLDFNCSVKSVSCAKTKRAELRRTKSQCETAKKKLNKMPRNINILNEKKDYVNILETNCAIIKGNFLLTKNLNAWIACRKKGIFSLSIASWLWKLVHRPWILTLSRTFGLNEIVSERGAVCGPGSTAVYCWRRFCGEKEGNSRFPLRHVFWARWRLSFVQAKESDSLRCSACEITVSKIRELLDKTPKEETLQTGGRIDSTGRGRKTIKYARRCVSFIFCFVFCCVFVCQLLLFAPFSLFWLCACLSVKHE